MSIFNNNDNPKRFLFNTQFNWPFAPVDYSLAMALRERGHKVAMVACGGLDAYCEQQTSMAQRQSCQSCIANIIRQFEKFKLPYYIVRDNYSNNDIAYANEISKKATIEELLKLNVKGVAVGKYARLNLFQYYHGYPFEITGDNEKVFRQIINSGVLLTSAKERIFDHYSPDMVITINGKFMQWAPFVDFAKQKGISFATYENLDELAPPSGVVFEINGIAHEQRIDDVWEEESKKPLSQHDRQQLYEHFELWKAGKLTYHPFYDDFNESSSDDVRKILGLRSGLPVVSLFPNVSWDSTSVGYESAFESMYHWAFKVVEYAKRQPDVEFIIRAHPHETKLPGQWKSSTPICDEIRNRYSPLPSNLKLVDSSHSITSYAIGNISDVVMVYTSTMGIEFALQGKQPWVAANPYYAGKGFTLDLKSAEHIFDLLDNNHFENTLSAQQINLTERFAHIVRTRRAFPFPYLDGETGKFIPPNLDVFKPGGNQIIDNLCSYILTGQPFLDIGTEKPTATINVPSSQTAEQVIIADDNLSNIKQLAQKQRFGNWQVKFKGLTIYCEDLLSFYIAVKDIFLHRIYDFESKTDCPVVIDGGGHIGLFTLFAKQKYPNAKITVFEPDKKSLGLLRKNLQFNSFNDVKIIESGLYKNNGEVSFNSDNSDGSSIYADDKNSSIQVVRLSDYIDSEIDFLKLNIEGAELDVLEEAKTQLQSVKEMVIEYHGFPEVGQNLHKILAILENSGFRYIVHDFDAETNPATKPPFQLDEKTRFYLLICARKLFSPIKPQTIEHNLIKNSKAIGVSSKASNTTMPCEHNSKTIEWWPNRTDPNGRLFRQDGKLYRAMINFDRTYYDNLINIIDSNEVLTEGIVKTTLTDKVISGYKCVLEHEAIKPMNRPCDWTFHMFKDALLKQIDVHIQLLISGYTLQDGHLWNIVFKHTSPILVDFGSIVPPNNKYKPLMEEYYHFCLLPLMLMVIGEFDKARRYLTSGSLPHLTHEDIHGYIVKDVKSHAVKGYYEFIELLIDEVGSDENFIGFLRKFKKIINDFFQIEQKSTWSVYHKAEEEGRTHNKIIQLERFFKENKGGIVLDVGCAAGFYSILAAQNGLEVVATEVDQPALDYTYSTAKQKQLRITPILRNIFHPGSDIDNNRLGNSCYDIVMAEALIHHLAFTQKMSLSEIVEGLSKYCNKHLIIEFMNENDTFVKKHIGNYQFDYSLDSLKQALCDSFKIDRIVDSSNVNRKLLFCTIQKHKSHKLKSHKRDQTSSLEPISRKFGFDRGKPIDRYYIEKFLNENRHLIQGRVLEIGDNTYTKNFGTGVTQSDILNAVPSPNATIVGDLTTGENIPEDAYDCIILTQTLHVVYNIRAAIQNAVKALKPNGVLLLTTPGISQISRYDMDRWGDYWRFTDKSLKMLLAEAIPQENVHIDSYGNVTVAKAFLDGLALHELPKDVLDYKDNDYQVLLTARIQKLASEISIRNTPQTDKIPDLSRDRSLAADFWSKVDCSESDKNFYCFSAIRTRSCKLIFDEFDASRTDWCEYWTVQKYLKDQIPFERCLSVCCGTGQVERTLAKLNVAKKIIGIDIAPGAIEKAKQRARDENLNNIEYYVSDLNTEGLKEDEYDIIWANGALHNIEELDSVIPILYKSLKRGGFLISNEYVGPKYQQIPQRQQEIINAVKHIMPPELRLKSQIEKYDTFGQIWKHTPMKYFLETDPSECINSNNIIPLLRKYFKDVEVKYFDGSILFYLLDSAFYDNFDINNQNHRRLLEMLFNIEDALIETGEIARDNAHIICNKTSEASLIQRKDLDKHIFNQGYISKSDSFKASSILLYHRVADDPIDSQLLTVSPGNFEAHLKELAENYRVLPLHQLLEEAGKNQLRPNRLAITFDDGYLDNLTNAVPLLEKYGLHATIFVVSGMVGSQSEFWWDALERIFLTGHPLPDLLSIRDSQGILEWDLTTAQNRLKAYDELCEFLRVLPFTQIDKIVNQLSLWAELKQSGRCTHRIVNEQQLKSLASSASVEIGSHSVTHTRLSSLPPQQQQYEIAESKRQLESIINKPVRLFSYPYGNLEDITKETGRILAGAGYDAGIANVQGSLISPVDMYAISRRLVRNWSGPMFARWLRDDEDKVSLAAKTLSKRAQKIINYQSLLISKEIQTIRP